MSRPCAISTQASHAPQGSGGGPLHAVQRLRQDTRGRRFARAARAGKHECMGNASADNRVTQGARHGLLPNDLLKLLRTPLAREDLVGHGYTLKSQIPNPKSPPAKTADVSVRFLDSVIGIWSLRFGISR